MKHRYLLAGMLSTLLGVTLLGGAWVELNALPVVQVPPQVLPAPNAFDGYVAAAGAVVASNWIDNAGSGPLAERQAALRRNARALRILRQALPLPYAEPREPRPWTAARPHYARFRGLARLLAMEASVYRDRGDAARAAQCGLDAIDLGTSLWHDAPFIGMLVGIACESIGQRSLEKDTPGLDAAATRAAVRRLEGILGRRASLADVVTEEKYEMQLGLLDAMGDPAWPKEAYELAASSGRKTDALRLLFTSKRLIMAHTTRAFDDLIAEARHPGPPKRGPRPPAGDPVSDALMVVGIPHVYLKNEARQALLLTQLALRAYRLEHGRYPDRLGQLMPAYLAQVPRDPYAAKGTPRYQPRGTGYVLYSVGPDGKDDGGKAIRNPGSPGRAATCVDAKSIGDMVAGVNW